MMTERKFGPLTRLAPLGRVGMISAFETWSLEFPCRDHVFVIPIPSQPSGWSLEFVPHIPLEGTTGKCVKFLNSLVLQLINKCRDSLDLQSLCMYEHGSFTRMLSAILPTRHSHFGLLRARDKPICIPRSNEHELLLFSRERFLFLLFQVYHPTSRTKMYSQ